MLSVKRNQNLFERTKPLSHHGNFRWRVTELSEALSGPNDFRPVQLRDDSGGELGVEVNLALFDVPSLEKIHGLENGPKAALKNYILITFSDFELCIDEVILM